MYASFNGIEIPRVYDVQITRQVQGDRARTAGGKFRQDVIAEKRIWTLQTRPMPLSMAIPLTNYLRSTLYTEGAFWLKEFGGVSNAVIAVVTSLEEKVMAFGENGTWHNDGRQLSLTIEEV